MIFHIFELIPDWFFSFFPKIIKDAHVEYLAGQSSCPEV